MATEREKALIDAMEAAVMAQGIDLYPGAAKLKRWMDRRYPMLVAAQSRESMEAFVSAMRIEDEALLKQLIVLVGALTPIVTALLNQHLQTIADDLPKAPPGRKLKVSTDDKRALVTHIADLYKRGVQLRDAQLRASMQFNVSLRTAQRVWRSARRLRTLHSSPWRTSFDS